MVNPITPGAAAATYGLPSSQPERPVSLPEPAVQVTAASEATDSGNATGGTLNRQDGQQPDGSAPLEKALEMLNSNLKAWSTGMRFDVDPEAQRVVVSIIDNETGDVLRTVPSDAVIRVAKMIVQLQGKSVDTRV
ncbi:flagellar protein FlaG [Pusillimonas sp. SM2304]|uniref:flagellar protein FlaG n=1 Tax=Pusillimonas sp. SM2304 TaxID=3073241 RepID=UPI002875F6BA|nr:flagellar protein FlaG [Pusillimonas sp. SM2304]MDS1141148.1 flagellar protein FlaG [Pusillimonas sp. SM2304]